MALNLNYLTPSSRVPLPDSYLRVRHATVRPDGGVDILIDVYSDKAARLANASPVETLHRTVTLPPAAMSAFVSQVYGRLKAGEFAGASDA